MRGVIGMELVWPSQVGAESAATVRFASPAAAPFSASKSLSETRPASLRVSPSILYVASTVRKFSGCRTCARNASALRKVKTEELNPSPNVSITMTLPARSGARASCRTPYRRSIYRSAVHMGAIITANFRKLFRNTLKYVRLRGSPAQSPRPLWSPLAAQPAESQFHRVLRNKLKLVGPRRQGLDRAAGGLALRMERCKVRSSVLVSTSTPLNQVRVNALPAHGFIRENGSVGVVTVDPCIDIPRPLLGIGSLQVGNGNGLHGLFGKFQHPLRKAQPARPRLSLERSFLLRLHIECDSHNLYPCVFSLAQPLYIGDFSSGRRPCTNHQSRPLPAPLKTNAERQSPRQILVAAVLSSSRVVGASALADLRSAGTARQSIDKHNFLVPSNPPRYLLFVFV